MSRISGALQDSPVHFQAFREIMLDMRFLPAGRVQSAMGSTRGVTAYNCYVSGEIQDTMVDGEASIMMRALEAAATMRQGGGIGYDFSSLRPRGAIIKKLDSKSSGPISFMHIFDAVCKCIASSGHRRGAQMGVLRVDHPDIEEFIRAKQPSGEMQVLWDLVEKIKDPSERSIAWAALQKTLDLSGFNVSVAITDEFMQSLSTGKPFDLKFQGQVYKTVDAAALWDMIMRSTWDYAEPGVLFIDTINKMNNLYYAEEIATTNPCVAAGTLVSTPFGLLPVEKVKQGHTVATVTGQGVVASVEKHLQMPVFKVSLSDGTSIRATAAHIFHVVTGKKCSSDTRLDQLVVGNKLRLAPSLMPNNPIESPFPELSDREYGLVVGSVIGDGCFTENSKSVKIACSHKEDSWASLLNGIFSKVGYSSITKSTDSCNSVTSHEVMNRLDKSPLSRGFSTEKKLPLELLNTNKSFLAGFLDGLVSTDGNVNMNGTNPAIRVESSSKESLMMAKRALSMFGILARVYKCGAKAKGSVNTIAGRTVTRTADGYTLVVLGSGIKTFHDQIGLSHPDKSARLKELVLKYCLTGCTWTATIKAIEPDGVADVYDLFEPATDTWITEGVVNRGCGEQPLPPYGACLLGSFNLVRYVSKTESGAFTFNTSQLLEDIPHVVRAMDNIVDRSKYPLREQEKEAKSKRRMGLGVTGLANAIEACGHPYGSKKFLKMQKEIMSAIKNGCYQSSVQLAQEKGAFPLFDARLYTKGKFIKTLDESVQKDIAKHGIRNSHLTSIAPTGTISLTADNVSSGIEPVFSYSYDRTIQTFDGPKVETVTDYGVRVFEVKGKRASEVSIEEHLSVLLAASKEVDSAVSKTCNVPGSVKWDEFKQLYVKAYEGGAKGCTTFRTDGKRMGILVANETEDQPAQELSCTVDPSTGRRSCE